MDFGRWPGVFRSLRKPFIERPDSLPEFGPGHRHGLPRGSARSEVAHVIVKFQGPESIETVSERKRPIARRQGKRRSRLGVDEREQGAKARSEHRLPLRQPFKIIGRHPVLPGPPTDRILAPFAFDLDDQIWTFTRVQ